MTNKQVRNNKYLCVLFVLLLFAAVFASGRSIPIAFADKAYTSALNDLQTDVNFDVKDYPSIPKDHSIQVIQIAESENGELFVYTYQPCQKTTYLVATEINMSLSNSVNGTKLYGLTLVSSRGTLCKYVVNELRVSSAAVRYYNITSIYREWNGDYDEKPGNDNTVNGVAFSVGQLWTVMTTSDGVEYSMTATEVVTVTSQTVGFRRYSDGFKWSGTKSCDAHYLLFNCDHDIDRLISADVAFNTQDYSVNDIQKISYAKDKIPHTAYLRYDDEVSSDGSGWFGKKEKWRRMVSTAEFMENAELSEAEKKVFSQYKWALNFYETEYKVNAGQKDILISLLVPFGFVLTIGNALSSSGTIVSDVTLLRLEFDCNGEIYNLGVVSNRQTGSGKPTNDTRFDFWKWLADKLGVPVWAAKAIFFGVLGVIVLAVALPVLSLVFPVFGQVLKTVFGALWTGVVWLLKGLLWLVLLPFKGIAALVRNVKDKKDGDGSA